MKCDRCDRYIEDNYKPLNISAKNGNIRLFLCRDCNIQALAEIKESLSIFMRKRIDLTRDADEVVTNTNEEQ